MAISDLQAEPATKSRPHRATLWYTFALVLFVGAFLFVSIRITLNSVEQGRRSSCKAMLAQVEQLIEMYRLDFDQYPPSLQSLEALTKPRREGHPPIFEFRGHGQNQPWILDPWGRPLVYRIHSHEGSFKGKVANLDRFELYSVGPNGIDEGGKGDDVSFDD